MGPCFRAENRHAQSRTNRCPHAIEVACACAPYPTGTPPYPRRGRVRGRNEAACPAYSIPRSSTSNTSVLLGGIFGLGLFGP
jgi:hypothetical protein